MGLQIEDTHYLLQAKSYRDFLSLFFKPSGKVSKPLSYAEFSRRAGFASRAFPRDIVNGERSINLKTLPQFIKGLGLTGDWREYFSLLVQIGEAKVENAELIKMQNKLIRLKSRLRDSELRLISAKENVNLTTRLYSIPHLPRIYAGMGTPDQGASLIEIANRTKIPVESLNLSLNQMLHLEMITYDPVLKKYLPQSLHRSFKDLGANNFFHHYFLQSASEMLKKATAKNRFVSDDKLFLQTSFSVDSKQLPKLKNALREVVLQFVEENESSTGDTVVDLTLGLYE